MRRSATALATIGALLLPALLAAPAAGEAAPYDAVVTSYDGVEIAVTVFPPLSESAPLILHSHGWSGSRAKSLEPGTAVTALHAAGYGLVSVDARGHGASGGRATIHNRDVEVKDFQAVLDFAATLPWVAADPSPCPEARRTGPDLLAGAIGGSYGGAYQLMTASFDCRLDSLAPEITWNDLTYSLAPDGAPKSDWLHVLYAAGKARARLDPRIDAWYQEVMATNAVPAAAFEHLKRSSPVPGDVAADVLLIQGVPDQLFNLNEALRNKAALESGVAGDVRLFTHLDGHIASAAIVDGRLPKVGLQPIGVGVERLSSPCGDVRDLLVDWFQLTLRGDATGVDIPEVSYAMEDGTCVSDFTELPPATASVLAVPAASGAGSVLVPVLDGPATLAGVPTISFDVATPGDARLYLSLVALAADGAERVVDDQSTAFSVSHCGTACVSGVSGELGGIATRLGPADKLFLRIEGLNEWFATNGDRSPEPVVVSSIELSLPRIEES